MLDISQSVSFGDSGGLNALNRVMNSPPGLRKYPTDPISTMDGDHNDRTTVQYRVVNLGVPFCIEDNVRDGWNLW